MYSFIFTYCSAWVLATSLAGMSGSDGERQSGNTCWWGSEVAAVGMSLPAVVPSGSPMSGILDSADEVGEKKHGG